MDYKKKYLKYKKKYLMAKKLYGGGVGTDKVAFNSWIVTILGIITDMETALDDDDEDEFWDHVDSYKSQVGELKAYIGPIGPNNSGPKSAAHQYQDDKLKKPGDELWIELNKFDEKLNKIEDPLTPTTMLDIMTICEETKESIETIEEELKQEENKE